MYHTWLRIQMLVVLNLLYELISINLFTWCSCVYSFIKFPKRYTVFKNMHCICKHPVTYMQIIRTRNVCSPAWSVMTSIVWPVSLVWRWICWESWWSCDFTLNASDSVPRNHISESCAKICRNSPQLFSCVKKEISDVLTDYIELPKLW